MSDKKKNGKKRTPLLLWPFAALWGLLSFVLNLTGRLLGVLLGLALMVGGSVLTVTFVAAPVGIPLVILGFLLLLRSLF